MLPETAVDYTLYGDSVYVVREDGTDADGKPVSRRSAPRSRPAPRWDGKVAILDGRQGRRPGRRRRVRFKRASHRTGARRSTRQPSSATPLGARRAEASDRTERRFAIAKAAPMSMKFTDIFIRRPVLALVVSLLILLIGLKAMLGPADPPVSAARTTRRSRSRRSIPAPRPTSIQGFITTPIEQAVATAEGIDYLTSNSIQGTSTVTAYIRLNYDPSKAMTDVMAKVQQVKYLIPTEAQDPIILKSTGQTTAVMYIGFASAELSERRRSPIT